VVDGRLACPSGLCVMELSKISLGTAQFGIAYGITNSGGRIPADEIARIMAYATSMGITSLDTAAAYGDAEETLGRFDLRAFSVTTKVPAYDGSLPAKAWLMSRILESAARLRVRPAAVLLHRPEDLLGPSGEELVRALNDAVDSGVIDGVGVSVYAPDDLTTLYGLLKWTDVQLPLNILDRRMFASPLVEKMVSDGVRFHVRSAFLQGLLLTRTEALPVRFSRWQPLWRRWWNWLDHNKVDPVAACMDFATSSRLVNRVVVGVLNTDQLRHITSPASDSSICVPDWMRSEDLDLIDPRRWSFLS
jgi:aryl-alcohol dehydrogenase-like predicted oxidoreductase